MLPSCLAMLYFFFAFSVPLIDAATVDAPDCVTTSGVTLLLLASPYYQKKFLQIQTPDFWILLSWLKVYTPRNIRMIMICIYEANVMY